MSFLPPFAAWLFAAFAVFLTATLVILYFLKLKRHRLKVPSLVLWQQVVNDNRVNSPFQAFRNNLLLWLQLLILLLLLLAALQPFFRGDVGDANRLPILIDRSASMAAKDRAGDSRLDLAKEEVREMIDGLGKDSQLALIAFGRTARQLTGFTNNKRLLYDALEKIEVEDTPSDLTDALRLADAMSRTARFEKALILTDGNLPGEVEFEVPFEPILRKLPAAEANMGITSLNARRAHGGGWNIFISVQGNSKQASTATLELIQDGQVRGTDSVTVMANQNQRIMFQVDTDKPTSIEVRLKPDLFDALESDNRAYLELAPARDLWVYCDEDLLSYRWALEALPDIRLYPRDGQTPADVDFDLLISEEQDEASQPQAPVRFYVNVIPEDLRGMIRYGGGAGDAGEDAPQDAPAEPPPAEDAAPADANADADADADEAEPPAESEFSATTVTAWDRLSPLLEFVELTDLLILDDPRYAGGADEGSLNERHFEVLAHAPAGPLILRRREGEQLSFYTLFHTDRSTLPYRVGFPIIVSNVVRIAMLQANLLEVPGDRTGVLPPIGPLAAETDHEVRGPGDYTLTEKTDSRGVLSGVAAPRVGRYAIRAGGEDRKLVGVSLLDVNETLMAKVDRVQTREATIEAEQQEARTDKSIWWQLALLGLVVMLVEWWFFQRRPGGWTR